MTAVDASGINRAIAELQVLLEADGATLRVVSMDEAVPRVELAVDFSGVECEECVLPPDRLHDTVAAMLSREAGTSVAVLLHDPRRGDVPATVDGGSVPAWVEVLDPTGVAPDVGDPDPGPAAGPLLGKTVVIRHDFLWNSFDWTVAEWEAAFVAAGATVKKFRRHQGDIGETYERTQAEYEALLAGADLNISGLGNCGSCTSWSVRDSLTAAAHGVPTAAIATAHFEGLARVLAAEGGRPGLRVMVLPYPYDTLPEDEVRAHAKRLFPTLLEVLGATV
ncbi:MAG: hypothetical protein AB7N61_05885 [Acidimicrobiia bacterium]